MKNEWSKWFRVIDPLNPLYGCDVRGDLFVVEGCKTGHLEIDAMRRVDMTVGDRPFQLLAKPGEYLGVTVDVDHLEESPLQDDVVELSTDRPFGLCIDDSKMERGDKVALHVVRYERAIQIALLRDGTKVGSKTNAAADRSAWESTVINLFTDGADVDDLSYLLRRD